MWGTKSYKTINRIYPKIIPNKNRNRTEMGWLRAGCCKGDNQNWGENLVGMG